MSPSTSTPNTGLPGALTDAAEEVVLRVQRSLVVLHNGRHGVGAGVIWGRNGSDGAYILTNYHVVAHGRQIRAALENGREIPTHLVATDEEIDLALLQVQA